MSDVPVISEACLGLKELLPYISMNAPILVREMQVASASQLHDGASLLNVQVNNFSRNKETS